MKRIPLLAIALVACNSEPPPDKAGPGEGYVWPGEAPALAAASAARFFRAPAPLPRPAPAAAPAPADLEKKLFFQDDFNRAALGPDWSFHGGTWMLKDGAVHSPFAQNKCLWLKRPIPADCVIEMEAWSTTPRGDLKFTVFGDGVEHETGYTLIFGGWFNSISVIARMDEHGADRKERHHRGAVVPGKRHRFEMRRVGARIDWYVDGSLYLTYDDPAPLRGPGHDRFAFCNWESQVYFDNLRIYDLAEKKASAAPDSKVTPPR
jgi:hypothetical protein